MPHFRVELEFEDGSRTSRDISTTDAFRAADFAEAHTPPFDVARRVVRTMEFAPPEDDGKIQIRTIRGETRARIAETRVENRRTLGGY